MSDQPWQDASLPLAQRIDDLIGRLTLAEKCSQLCNSSRAIERLGIPAYDWWNEALHGVARNGRATVFPQAIALAATFDRGLIRRIADAISDEARAKHHAAVAAGRRGIYQGLNFWSPNVNIFRDPRWGRGHETWGEDPYLAGELGAEFVRGLQGDDPEHLKTAACAKHYAVHSGPERERHGFDARPTPQDLRETYLPQFRKLVRAGVEVVMGAYNRVSGHPACAHPQLLQEILRGEWGFRGHVVSDCGAIRDFHKHHRVTASPAESIALAVRLGCDLSCGCLVDDLPEAVARGLVREDEIDACLRRVLATRFRLGLLDREPPARWAAIPLAVVNSPEHRRIAREAAAASMVLLKNDGILPLPADLRSLFVTGPTAADSNVLLGNYYGLSPQLTTFVAGIAGRIREGTRIEYRMGCMLDTPNRNPINWALYEAPGFDCTVACLGLTPMHEGEEGESIAAAEGSDRSDLGLPADQVAYLRALRERVKRLVLVVTGGCHIDLAPVWDLADAIIQVWYPGEAGGEALADVLWGDAMPSGRLPFTVPRSLADLPDYADYRMDGRGYRFATAEPLLPFGFGLSYVAFAYRGLELSASELRDGDGLTATVRVANLGERDADEVVQLYLVPPRAAFRTPLAKLVGFARVRIAARSERAVELRLAAEDLRSVDDQGRELLLPGLHRLVAAGCSPGPRARALGAAQPVEAAFTARG